MKIGFLYPSDGLRQHDFAWILECLFPEGDVTAVEVITSSEEDLHTVDAVFDLGRADRLEGGVRELADHGDVAACMWACTAGSFTYGWDGAQEQAAGVRNAFGGPSSSTSVAFVEALRSLGLTRVAIAATYPQPVADAFALYLTEAGFEVVETQGNDYFTAADALVGGRNAAVSIVRSVSDDRAQAVLMPDTALHTAQWLEELEGIAGKPVLTATQVTVWEALRLIDRPVSAPDLGTLFRGRPAVARAVPVR